MAIISAIGSLAGVAMQGAYQNKMLDEQNDFNASQAEAARLFASEPERFNRMVKLGFNPDLAASSIMGQSAASVPFSPSSSALGAAPDFSQLGNLLGGLPNQLLQQKLQEAQISNLNSSTKYQDIMNGYAPLTMQAQIDYLGAYKDKLVADGKMSDEMASFYNEQTKWIPILSHAEASQRYAETMETFAKIDEIWSQIDVNVALSGKYDADAALSWQQVKESFERTENLKKEGLILDNRVEQSSYERDEAWASSVQAVFDANYRGLMNGMPMSGDAMKDLIFMRATPEGREFSNKFIEEYFNGARQLYDFDMENRMNHYWDSFFLSLGADDVTNTVGNLSAAALIARGRGGMPLPSGMQTTTPPGRPVNRKISSRSAAPSGSGHVRGNPKGMSSYKYHNGKSYKFQNTDRYGNNYYRASDGSVLID